MRALIAAAVGAGILLTVPVRAQPGPAPAATERRFTLANGLTGAVRRVEGAQNVALLVLYRIGSGQDPDGSSGLAHLIEHVYITAAAGATPARTAQAFMQAYPSGWNAQTGEDYTVFATVFAPDRLAAEASEAASRMSDLRPTTADLEREKPRVLEEVANMFDGQPALAAWNRAYEQVRPSPPHGRRGGVPDQVRALTLAAVQRQWQRYYKPANALVVVAGAVDPAAAEAALRRTFGGLAAGDPAPPPRPRGQPRLGEVTVVASASSALGVPGEACLMYAAPAFGSPLFAPFLVLAARMQMHSGALIPPSGSASGRFPPPVYFATLDSDGVLSLSTPQIGDEKPQAAAARLRAFVSRQVKGGLEPGEADAARDIFGPYLGMTPLPDAAWASNPYGLAFCLARWEQTHIPSSKLRLALTRVTTRDLRDCATAVFPPARSAAVVVETRTP